MPSVTLEEMSLEQLQATLLAKQKQVCMQNMQQVASNRRHPTYVGEVLNTDIPAAESADPKEANVNALASRSGPQ